MITHIVMWTLAATDDEQRAADAAAITESLERLVGIVPGLRSLTVTANTEDVPANFDLVLRSEMDDRAALDRYLDHPEHLAAVAIVRPRVNGRAAIDVAS